MQTNKNSCHRSRYGRLARSSLVQSRSTSSPEWFSISSRIRQLCILVSRYLPGQKEYLRNSRCIILSIDTLRETQYSPWNSPKTPMISSWARSWISWWWAKHHMTHPRADEVVSWPEKCLWSTEWSQIVLPILWYTMNRLLYFNCLFVLFSRDIEINNANEIRKTCASMCIQYYVF